MVRCGGGGGGGEDVGERERKWRGGKEEDGQENGVWMRTERERVHERRPIRRAEVSVPHP